LSDPTSEEIVEENQELSAKQKIIIAIAAFTANGDLEKLRLALSEGWLWI
jgi:hypothetical protein